MLQRSNPGHDVTFYITVMIMFINTLYKPRIFYYKGRYGITLRPTLSDSVVSVTVYRFPLLSKETAFFETFCKLKKQLPKGTSC